MQLDRRDSQQVTAGDIHYFADIALAVRQLVADCNSVGLCCVSHYAPLALTKMLGSGYYFLAGIASFSVVDGPGVDSRLHRDGVLIHVLPEGRATLFDS